MNKINYWKFALISVALGLAATSVPASAQLFTPGNLIVSTYGNSATTTLDGQPTPITLIEYATSGGVPLLSYTLPTTDGLLNPGNVGVVGEYGSSSEGNIQLTGSGQYLTVAGYSATPSFAGNYGNSFPAGALAQATDTTVPRVAIFVDGNGNVNSSSIFSDLYTTNNPRAVYSVDGTSLYISGQGDKQPVDQGVFYAPTGTNTVTTSNTPSAIYNTKDTRYVTGYGGDLYYSLDKSGAPTGIFKISGLPTSGSPTPVQITAASNGLTKKSLVSYSPEGFYFANATTLYVADTGVPKIGGTGNGGIQKWVSNGTTWTLQYTLVNPNFVAPTLAATATTGETGFEAITGQVAGDTVQLFAVSYTAGDDNSNGLYAITDSLSATTPSGQTFTELESAAGNGGLNFKGVCFAPTPAPIKGISGGTSASSVDVGYVGQPGSTSYEPSTGTYTLSGSGSGIGLANGQDGFQFAGVSFSGDSTFIAQLSSQSGGGESGIMFRLNLGTASPFISVVYQAGVGTVVKWNSSAETPATILGVDNSPTIPSSIALVRSGNTFIGYEFVDGAFKVLGTLNAPADTQSNYDVGLVESSDQYQTTSTASFYGIVLNNSAPQ